MHRALALTLLLALPIALHAQSPSDVAAPAALNATGAFFAVSVADLEASVRWYTEKLGLRVAQRLPKVDKAALAILSGGGLIVELVHNDDAVPRAGEPVLVRGIFKVGVIVDSLAKTLAILRSRQVPIAFGPFPAKPGAMANAIVRDNAGNLIQFFGR
jgi:catechol 2,3-dioxygenase-like lactoylglutathione lyase family enzyme